MTTFSIPFSSVIEGTRARDSAKYGNIDELAESLKRLGTIQPIVLSLRAKDPERGLLQTPTYDLIAGGRRYRAIQALGITELWHGSTLDPTKLGFLFADEVPEDVRREAELEENLRRLQMDWIDETLTIADLHAAKTKAKVKWTTTQTAALLGYDSGFIVKMSTKAAKLLRAGDKEVLACKDFGAVVALFSLRKEAEALGELQRRVKEKFAAPSVSVEEETKTESFIDLVIGAPKENKPFEAPATIPLSSMFHVGDSITVMRSIPDASFNHIVTDIPYGIDMENLDAASVAITKDGHDVSDNIALMRPFLEEAYRLTKPHGFCCFFFDLDYLQYLQATAADVGWKVQRWPIIITKTSSCRNTCAQYNTTKNYESLLFLRRDEHTVLRSAVSTSWLPVDFAVERPLYAHPFFKPFAAWKFIYDAIAFTGQTVLDPFCGECSGAKAAVNCGLIPHGIDMEEGHILRGLVHVRDAYTKLLGSHVQFT